MDAVTQAAPAVPTLTHRQTLLVVMGVLLPVFMGSLDQTIVAGALPSIGRELHNVQLLPWLITIYLIATAATTPLYGKLADIHGRRVMMIGAISFYLVGSLTCALSSDMAVLILGRAVQGIGGGGLTSIGMTVLGDITAPKNRARYYTYFAISYTTAGGIGPALGGFLSEQFHWSMVFWFNIPLGVTAMTLALTCLRRLPRRERPHRLDILGALLIVATTIALMLALNLETVRHSVPLLTVSAVLVAAFGSAFVVRLATAPEPLIPLTILRDPTACQAIVMHAFGWAAVIELNIYLPLYLQGIIGLSPTYAGLSLVIFMSTLNMSGAIGTPIIAWATHYKILPMLGLTVSIGCLLILAFFPSSITPLVFEALLFLIGLGFGQLGPLSMMSVQNTVAPHQYGTAVGVMNFARVVMSTVVVSVIGAIVAGSSSPHADARIAGLADANGFRWVFLVAAGFMGVSLLMMALLEEKPMKAVH